MYPELNYLCLLLLLINSCCAIQRTLKTSLDPGCDDLCKAENVTTLYLRADGPNDTLHYVWDFFGNPTLLLAITSPSAQLTINWNDYLTDKPRSINFTEEPRYTFGLAVQKLIEFNDVDDTGLLVTASDANIKVLDTKNFNWVRKSISNSTQFVELQMNGGEYWDILTNTVRRGNVQMMLNGFCTLEHSDVMPHMLHSENSTQIDIILDNLETNSKFENSRFAIELLLVSETKADIGMLVDTKKSLDDEYTPGIFEVIELTMPSIKIQGNQENSAYLQWRPVSYTAPSRASNQTTENVYYPLVNISNPSNVARGSLLHAYYGDRMDHLLVEKINISLGMKGDGFYKKSNYSTWTVLVGYGDPPAEKFSYLVIMILSIGIGLPFVMLIVVGIYFCARRVPKRYDNAFINS